jgi:hypothetical protein
MRNAITVGHVPIQNDHGGDMKRDWGDKERDVRELDQLVVKDDDVVRRNDC